MATGNILAEGNLDKIKIITMSINPASIAANTSAEQQFGVTGVLPGDVVFVNKSSVDAGTGIVGARVSSANTVGITFGNFTGGAIDPGSQTFTLVIVRPEQGITLAAF